MKKLILLVAVVLVIWMCSRKNETAHIPPSASSQSVQSVYNSTYNVENDASIQDHHTDREYKYEYRTGPTGSYEYNYDVTGTDEYGNEIGGNIDISGKYGTGTIEDADGNEKAIDVEWVDYGVLEATDEDGNTYEMEVE